MRSNAPILPAEEWGSLVSTTPAPNSYIRWSDGEILQVVEIGANGNGKIILIYDPSPIYKNIIGYTLDIPHLNLVPFKTLEPHEITALKLMGLV